MGQPLPFSNIARANIGYTGRLAIIKKITPTSLESASCRATSGDQRMPFHREPTTFAYRRRSAPYWRRAVGLSRDKDIQWSADHGQITAVTKSFSGEISLQQCKFILQDIPYRLGVR